MGGPLETLANALDAFAAGMATELTDGGSDRAREGMYGETATKNQEGGINNAGRVAGFILDTLIGVVNPCNAPGNVGKAIRALNAIKSAGDLLNAVDSYKKGDTAGTVMNTLSAALNVLDLFGACFAAGTPLLTPNGAKLIEDIQIGDLVLSRSEHDSEGDVVARRVATVFQAYSPLLDLHIGGQVIRTTAQHPFWVVGIGWTQAQQIERGQFLLGANGERTAVDAIIGPTSPAPVFNLEVEVYHTYLVGGESWNFSIWAHNTRSCTGGDGGGTAPKGMPRSFGELIKDAAAKPSNWEVVQKEVLASTNMRNKGGTSVQELLRNTETGKRSFATRY